MYGLIDEDSFSLHTPRLIDEGPFDTLKKAMNEACDHIEEYGTRQLAIVDCRFSKKHDCYVEIVNSNVITIDAENWDSYSEG